MEYLTAIREMPVKIIGITGNSGSGKSYVSEFIKKYYLEQNIKAKIIDADQVAKSMQNSKSEYMRAIVREFGEDIIEEEKLNRKKLAKTVFGNKQEKEKLDTLTQKYVVANIKEQIEMLKKQEQGVLILDVPLLFESGLNQECTITIGVIAKKEKKLERICKRDNITVEEAELRLNSQPDDEYYRNNCDYIIENNTIENEITQKAICNIIKKIEKSVNE